MLLCCSWRITGIHIHIYIYIYSKRYSDIYEGRRSSKELSHQLKEQKNIHNQTVKGKIGKGFTDQELGIDVEKLDKLITNSKYE